MKKGKKERGGDTELPGRGEEKRREEAEEAKASTRLQGGIHLRTAEQGEGKAASPLQHLSPFSLGHVGRRWRIREVAARVLR